MTNQSDKAFIDKIDCNFPYNDKEAFLHLIDEAAALSTNAMFFVIEELCRVPSSNKDKVTADFLLDLLSETKSKFHHPLKEMVLDTASTMIKRQELTVDEAISRMESVKSYEGQFSALNIIYFSCDDKEDRLETIYNSIISDWKKTPYNVGLAKNWRTD